MSLFVFVMSASVSIASPVLSVTAEQTAIVALVVVVGAFWALKAVDRLRFPAGRRPVPVPVEHLEMPLHREPEPAERLRAAGKLGGGAVLVGALAAIVMSVVLAAALQVVGGLLG
jgi:hypothetical protein